METVILTVHLILAALLIGVVLLQRSEGGGLGMGGGGGGGVMSGRQAANALSKLTWILAIAFLVTSISLTVIAARNTTGGSIMDRVGNTVPTPATEAPVTGTTTLPTMPDINALPQSAPATETPAQAPVEAPAPAPVPATNAPAAAPAEAPADAPAPAGN